MNSIEKLAEMFAKFPGIGPRQAKRFVYFILSRNGSYASELVQAIQNLKREIAQCSECLRYFSATGQKTCSICADETRDSSLLMVVPRDIDLDAVEKSGSYKGRYFVLGGVVPILEKEPEKRIRIRELEAKLKGAPDIKEVILAMNANLDGESTVEYLKDKLGKIENVQFSILGRGLSTGTELEYADPETLKNALLHRTK
jgi:recombination protein RecR